MANRKDILNWLFWRHSTLHFILLYKLRIFFPVTVTLRGPSLPLARLRRTFHLPAAHCELPRLDWPLGSNPLEWFRTESLEERRRRRKKAGGSEGIGQEVGSSAKSELVVCVAEVGAPILRPSDAPPRQRGLNPSRFCWRFTSRTGMHRL